MIFWFQHFDLMLMPRKHFANSALRIFHIPDDSRTTDAGFHTGWQQTDFQAVRAERAFIGGLGAVINKSGIIRAGLHTVSAADAACVIDNHNPIFALERRLNRTHWYTGWLIAVITQSGQQNVCDFVAPFQFDLVLIDVGAKRSLRRLVFYRATHGAGLAANAAA